VHKFIDRNQTFTYLAGSGGLWPTLGSTPTSSTQVDITAAADVTLAILPRITGSAIFQQAYGTYQFFRFDKVVYTFKALVDTSVNQVLGAANAGTAAAGCYIAIVGTRDVNYQAFPESNVQSMKYPSYSSLIDLPRVRKVPGNKHFHVTIYPKQLKYRVTQVGGGVITGDQYDYSYTAPGRQLCDASSASAFNYGALVYFEGPRSSYNGYNYMVETTYHFTLINPY